MKKFYLKHRTTEEVISQVTCDTIEEAVEYFCEQKKLTKADLLIIFKVSE